MSTLGDDTPPSQPVRFDLNEYRSIRYQMGAARLPLAKTVEDFRFAGTPINEALVRDLHAGGFLATQAQRRIRRRNR